PYNAYKIRPIRPSLRGAKRRSNPSVRACGTMDCFAALAMTSVRVLALRHQRDRRPGQDVEIEQHRPVLDVVQIELDALLDLLVGLALAAPSVDLRPAGDAGLDAVAGEVAVDGLVEQPALQLALHRMRTRTDQRQVVLEHDVEQLRQFVEAG